MRKDIRWKQRFENYTKALQTLSDAVELAHTRALSALEEQGFIKAFEFTYELGWNVLKDYLEYQGIGKMIGARDACREAFRRGLIDDGEVWMKMIGDRNLTSHTYDESTADQIAERIKDQFHPAFVKMEKTLGELYKRQEDA